MWFKTRSYLKFLLRSFHLHGIHSPFVFHLSNYCFKGKKNEVFPKLIEYLRIEQILLFGNSTEVAHIKSNMCTTTSFDSADFDQQFAFHLKRKTVFDLLYFPATSKNTVALFHQALFLAHGNSVFVFEKIHGSKEMEQIWKQIKQSEEIHVSIDTFHWGFVFFRKEQVKEDFTVRVRG